MRHFALECRAICRLRDAMGFRNVVVMIPFCRSTKEADQVLAVMAENGLKRGENGLEVYVMCEIPSNVILASAFADVLTAFPSAATISPSSRSASTATPWIWRNCSTNRTRR